METVQLGARDRDVDRRVRGVGAEHVVAGALEARAQRVEIRALDSDAELRIVASLSSANRGCGGENREGDEQRENTRCHDFLSS